MKTGKTALITGASSGIGLELAKTIASHGYNVVLVARRLDALEAAAGLIEGKHGVTATVLSTDLSHPEVPQELHDKLLTEKIEIAILVNSAGFGLGGEFLETDLARELEMIQVNIAALTQLTKLFAAGMVRRRWGRIMNVASTAAFQPGPLMAVYYATKAYVLSFSEAIAEELLRETGVTVTALCPGATDTRFGETAQVSNTKLFGKLGLADAEDVAAYGYKAMMRGRSCRDSKLSRQAHGSSGEVCSEEALDPAHPNGSGEPLANSRPVFYEWLWAQAAGPRSTGRAIDRCKIRDIHDLFGTTNRNQPASTVSSFGSHVDHPVRELDDVEVVLDQQNRVSLLDEPIHHLGELSDVVEVESRRRLVHDVQLSARSLSGGR